MSGRFTAECVDSLRRNQWTIYAEIPNTHRSGVVGTCGCIDDDDLYTRLEYARGERQESSGFATGRGMRTRAQGI
jgi:hypothetical protein